MPDNLLCRLFIFIFPVSVYFFQGKRDRQNKQIIRKIIAAFINHSPVGNSITLLNLKFASEKGEIKHYPLLFISIKNIKGGFGL